MFGAVLAVFGGHICGVLMFWAVLVIVGGYIHVGGVLTLGAVLAVLVDIPVVWRRMMGCRTRWTRPLGAV